MIFEIIKFYAKKKIKLEKINNYDLDYILRILNSYQKIENKEIILLKHKEEW